MRLFIMNVILNTKVRLSKTYVYRWCMNNTGVQYMYYIPKKWDYCSYQTGALQELFNNLHTVE